MITTLVSSNSSISKYTMTYMPSGQYHLKTHMWKQTYSVFFFLLNRATNAKRFLTIGNYNNMAEKTFRLDCH
jgi:hypothetical protein